MIDMYVNQKKSSVKLAKIFNCSDVFIINILKKHNIDRRSNSENHKGKHFYPQNEFIKGHTPWNKGLKIDRKKHPNMGHFQKHTKKSMDKMRKSTYHTNLNGKNSPKYISFEPYKEEMIKLYKQGLDTRQLAVLYNTNMTTIRHRFNKWGVKLRKSLYMGSKNLIADDGHKVKSYSELFIDNWLFHNGIIHVYEKRIGMGNFKTDFYIPEANIWVEYLGLQDVKTYREKTKRKLEIYKSLGLNLLSIFPSDNIQKKLNFLLQYSQIQKPLEVFI